jgi:hypothetical protein
MPGIPGLRHFTSVTLVPAVAARVLCACEPVAIAADAMTAETTMAAMSGSEDS